MKNIQFEVEDVFGDITGRDNFSQDQKNKLEKIFCQSDVNKNISIKLKLPKRRR